MTGWKCDNGFRSGYLNQLETIMCKHFPNTDLRAEPHINSKIHVWKKYYSSLMGMMSKSGFGWDESRHMVTVENNDVWDEYLKVDPSVRTMRFKSWPFFNAWREIFGKDGAQVNNRDDECYVPTAEWYPENGFIGEDVRTVQNTTVQPDPTINSTTAVRKSGSTGKKRKVAHAASDERLVDCVSTFCEAANVRMVELTKRLFVDFDEVEKRSSVFAAVANVEGLDMTEQLMLADRLVKNPKKMDLFFSLNETARKKILRLMLEGKM
ncbi:UNVERIFIED_CONTAM: hypothetical protein Sradi_7173900 [Sesamum radiatum]|uniref:Myb/SANT-like domain-containing protein n=1 Tax=Sesamum radiatum TaxID=300843 RepID=A0AAW2ISS8_SESRA